MNSDFKLGDYLLPGSLPRFISCVYNDCLAPWASDTLTPDTPSFGQGVTGMKHSRVQLAVFFTGLAAFVAAAMRNALLCNELNWTFGGKQQRGWYLYAPLISRLLDMEHGTASNGFALALSWWQEKSGLRPSGVLDEESLYAMISEWQGRRVKEHAFARPDQLVTAPASDFYDPSRPDELRQVERETYAAYKLMIAAAAADPSLGLALGADIEVVPAEKYLKILSSFRT